MGCLVSACCIRHAVLFRFCIIGVINHSENTIITRSGLLESEVEPGVLHSNAQQTFVSSCVAFSQDSCLLNTELENSRFNLVFEMPNILSSECSSGGIISVTCLAGIKHAMLDTGDFVQKNRGDYGRVQ